MSTQENLPRNSEQSSLTQAQALTVPSREEMIKRTPSVHHFWDYNRGLLENAWREWESNETSTLIPLDDSVIDDRLHKAVTKAWQDPSTDLAVRELWQEVAPCVYKTQFFSPEKIRTIRAYFDHVAKADIPLRPPYGIALNRFGAMLDPRSEGYLAAPSFQTFYNQLLDKYMRPVARLLFPEVTGYDTQTFGFSIRYMPGMDTSLRLHTDASSATMNINMNLPDESFEGSEVDFYDPVTGTTTRLNFEPGTAMIHRGSTAHAAQTIKSGQRSNMVLWLYGDHMQIPRSINQSVDVAPLQRWTIPNVQKDNIAPF